MKDPINLQYTTIKDPLPDFVYEGLKPYSSNANTYKPQPPELVKKLSKKHGIPADMIYLTAGCDEAIQMFIHAYGESTYAFTPTYVVYSDANEFGRKFTMVDSVRDNDFKISLANLSEATLIFLANPNNPLGYTSKNDVIKLIENNSHAKVIIDEAYGDFADISVVDKVKRYPNMAVLRSFSKGYAMAGNRVGYIIANPEIISVVKNKAQWSNVSYLSVGAAMVALNNENYFKNIRQNITKVREDFMEFLRDQEFTFLPSKINAVVLKFGDKKKGSIFFNFLKKNGIIASLGNGNSNIGLNESFVRIAIGTKDQMVKVKEVILSYKGRQGK